MSFLLRCLWLIAVILPGSLNAQPTKRALIIAIDHYPSFTGWASLASARDTEVIKAALLSQRFEEKNIAIVADTTATIDGIKRAFDKLIHSAQRGDIIVVHFSTHGEQVEDDNGDESDGLDECVVTYNAVAPEKTDPKNYNRDQAQYLRDDLLGIYIGELRQRLGKNGDLLLIMDFCHSGSGTKGRGVVRGDQPPLVSPTFRPRNIILSATNGGMIDVDPSAGGDTLSSFVAIEACRDKEVDTEVSGDDFKIVGPLSNAIGKVFGNLDSPLTYHAFFARVEAVMNQTSNGQHPVLEGNGGDRQLFGGKYEAQKPYFAIDDFLPNGNLILRGGIPVGLDLGAKVAIFPSGTVDPHGHTPLAAGVVVHAKYYSCEVKPDRDPQLTQPSLGWVFVTTPVYNIRPVAIATTGYSPNEITAIGASIKDVGVITPLSTAQLVLARGSLKDTIKIASNGYIYNTIPNVLSDPATFKDSIKGYAQYDFLRRLDIRDTGASVDVKLVPFRNGNADTTQADAFLVNGIYELRANTDTMVFWVKNNSSNPVFFNVLDMWPDGIIAPMLPNRRKNVGPLQLQIGGHSAVLFNNFRVWFSPPFGTEILKIFASQQQINIESLAVTKGRGTKANFAFLEKIVQRSYAVGIKGDPGDLGNADGSIYSLLLRVKPPH